MIHFLYLIVCIFIRKPYLSAMYGICYLYTYRLTQTLFVCSGMRTLKTLQLLLSISSCFIVNLYQLRIKRMFRDLRDVKSNLQQFILWNWAFSILQFLEQNLSEVVTLTWHYIIILCVLWYFSAFLWAINVAQCKY